MDGIPNFSGAIPPPGPSKLSSPITSEIPGIPLNPAARETAGKITRVAANVLMGLAIASIALVCIFLGFWYFKATPFKYASISWIAALIFTQLAEFVRPCDEPLPPPQDQRQGGHRGQSVNLATPPDESGSRGQTQLGPIPPPLIRKPQISELQASETLPPFIQGQPVQLTNEASSCFIDATFWEIMAWPEMKNALVESYQEWDRRFQTFEKFIQGLKGSREDFNLTGEEVHLLVTLFGSELGSDFFKAIGSKGESVAQLNNLLLQFREARFKGNPDPIILDTNIVLDIFKSHFFDDSLIQSLEKGFENLSRKILGIRGFLQVVEKYEEAGRTEQHHANIALTPLRNLLPLNAAWGQQDANEMLRCLVNLVDQRRYSHLFFSVSVEQYFTPYNPDSNTKEEERLQRHIQTSKTTDRLPENSRKMQDSVLTYEFQLPLDKEISDGQLAFNGLFIPHQGMGHDLAIYLNPEGKPALYKIEQECFRVAALPQTFILQLKRFETNGTGLTSKNTQILQMPQVMKWKDQSYELISIKYHFGFASFGHYTTCVKQGDTWWFCDDMEKYIYKATDKDLKEALELGYGYLYKKCL